MKRSGLIGLLLSVALLASCAGKDTEDLIVGTWEMVSIVHQSTGHPNQSMNGITTDTYGDGEKTMTMTFRKDGSGCQSNEWLVNDRVYIVEDDSIVYVNDTSYYLHDSRNFTYFASGNQLNIREGEQQKKYRIDKLDNKALSYTDTNNYSDTYTDSYGRTIQFTQETKTVYNLRRK